MGIKTVSPSCELDVVGEATITTTLAVGSSTIATKALEVSGAAHITDDLSVSSAAAASGQVVQIYSFEP